MSSTVRAQFWLWLPTRRISPLRTYQTVPSTSRTRVTRRPTFSTVPIASPRSTASPTPYWSSIIIITPDRKSLTRFWAPKPIASPSTPALARMGATFMPTSESTITKAMPKTTVVVMLFSRVPRLFARWARRLKVCLAPGSGAVSARLTTRSIAFEATHRTTMAPRTMTRMASGLPISQVAPWASVSLPVQS